MVVFFLTLTVGKQEWKILRYLMMGFAFAGLFHPQFPLLMSETDSVFLLKLYSLFVGIRAPVRGGKTWCPKGGPSTVFCRMESSSSLSEQPTWEHRLPLMEHKGFKVTV